MKTLCVILFSLATFSALADNTPADSATVYKKRVLESTEIDFLASYYSQKGDHAAVSGGVGTEKLQDVTPTFVVAVPLNDDDVLTIDAGISAYSSASSSNIDPFDGKGDADPFQASTGASSSDVWANFNGTYTHSSDNRNRIWSAKISVSSEFDYFSAGFGGSYSMLFNDKNTELSFHGEAYFDQWSAIYPIELRPFESGGSGINDFLFQNNAITGNPDYSPLFKEFNNKGRNSVSLGIGFSQILSRKLQTSLALDYVMQSGLLSTPFQRVYFEDIADSYIQNFHLADDIERLPDSRTKTAIGGRLHYYINQIFVLRLYYRYYFDDWNISSHTASIEVPVKISSKFTLLPSYRYYDQKAAKYFKPYNKHHTSEKYYTSDYDLSGFSANQYGFGVAYTDIFAQFHIWLFGLKSIDVKYMRYDRNISFEANMISLGFKFVMD